MATYIENRNGYKRRTGFRNVQIGSKLKKNIEKATQKLKKSSKKATELENIFGIQDQEMGNQRIVKRGDSEYELFFNSPNRKNNELMIDFNSRPINNLFASYDKSGTTKKTNVDPFDFDPFAPPNYQHGYNPSLPVPVVPSNRRLPDNIATYNFNSETFNRGLTRRRIIIANIDLEKYLLLTETNNQNKRIRIWKSWKEHNITRAFVKIAPFNYYISTYQSEVDIYRELSCSDKICQTHVVPLLYAKALTISKQTNNLSNQPLKLALPSTYKKFNKQHQIVLDIKKFPKAEVNKGGVFDLSRCIRHIYTSSNNFKNGYESKYLVYATGSNPDFKTMVQVTNQLLNKLKNYPRLTDEIINQISTIVISVILTITYVHREHGLVHGDFHGYNVLIDINQTPSVNEVSKYFGLDDIALYNVKLFDFDFSITRKHYDPNGSLLSADSSYVKSLLWTQNMIEELFLTTTYGLAFDIFYFMSALFTQITSCLYNHEKVKKKVIKETARKVLERIGKMKDIKYVCMKHFKELFKYVNKYIPAYLLSVTFEIDNQAISLTHFLIESRSEEIVLDRLKQKHKNDFSPAEQQLYELVHNNNTVSFSEKEYEKLQVKLQEKAVVKFHNGTIKSLSQVSLKDFMKAKDCSKATGDKYSFGYVPFYRLRSTSWACNLLN